MNGSFPYEATRRDLRAAARGGRAADVFRAVADRISVSTPADGWCGLTLDPSTQMMTGGVHEHGLSPDAIGRMLDIEYGGDDVNLFADLARGAAPVGVLSEPLEGVLDRSARFRDVLRPSGYKHELRLVARSGGSAWGAMVLLREPGRVDFAHADADRLNALSPWIAEAVQAALLAGATSAALETSTRAIVVLDARNEIETATPGAAEWIDDIEEVGPRGSSGVPQSLLSVANEARRLARDEAGAALVARTRLRTRSGRWLTLHATQLGAGTGSIAVMMEPSRSEEVASLIFQAMNLSKREGEAAALVLKGFDTEQIASAMGISPYTVQDHLKAIFAKAGVSGRRQLVAKVFFSQYWPRMARGAKTDFDGAFPGSER